MAGKFEVYEDAGGKYRFRLKAGNGEIVATGQGYASKDAAHKGVEAVRRAADGASVIDVKSKAAA
ncbi:YegP family protein [Kitasatospora sp. NPDC056327]|uniref:YegP family protein n=1 Tax=Kitasatospora sp. NPDC056327 TaxID=3345785 RepID=UPI0035E36A5A